MSEEEDQIGAVTGLAWTEVGGELLTIEAVTVPGKGQIKTTGKLGDVMQESIQAAFSFVKARAPSYGVKPSVFAPQGHPRPPARRRGAQGRPVGRHRHGHRDHLDPDRHSGAPRRRDDRRGHAARPRAADRRPQGEIARGAARRHHQGADPGREREGPRRDPGQYQAKGSRSSPSPMSTRCWPTRWRRRSCRSNGARPTTSPRCRRRSSPPRPTTAGAFGPPLIRSAAHATGIAFPPEIASLSFDSCSSPCHLIAASRASASASSFNQGFGTDEQAGSDRPGRGRDRPQPGRCVAGGRGGVRHDQRAR